MKKLERNYKLFATRQLSAFASFFLPSCNIANIESSRLKYYSSLSAHIKITSGLGSLKVSALTANV